MRVTKKKEGELLGGNVQDARSWNLRLGGISRGNEKKSVLKGESISLMVRLNTRC